MRQIYLKENLYRKIVKFIKSEFTKMLQTEVQDRMQFLVYFHIFSGGRYLTLLCFNFFIRKWCHGKGTESLWILYE